jgi:hypothetical protein
MDRWFCIQSVGAGDMVAVTYSGWIVGADGKLGSAPYDSNAGRDPLKLAIGAGSPPFFRLTHRHALPLTLSLRRHCGEGLGRGYDRHEAR